MIQRLISHSIFLICFIAKCVDEFVCIFPSIFLLKFLLAPTLTAFVFITPQVVLLSHNQIIYVFLCSVNSWSLALERCGHSYFLETFYSFLRKVIILSSFLFYLLGRSILDSLSFSVSLSSLIYINNINASGIIP